MSTQKQTSKSILRIIEKGKKKREKLSLKLAEMKSEMKALSKEIKALEKQHDEVAFEELKSRIATIWVKEENLSDEQILKFLELSKKVSPVIEFMDTEEVAETIKKMYSVHEFDTKATSQKSQEGVGTNE